MRDSALKDIVSAESILRHKEHYRRLQLRYSVLVKSFPQLACAEVGEIFRLRLPPAVKRRAAEMYSDILAHKLFFSSFSENGARSKAVAAQFGSEAAFLYELARSVEESDHVGFLLVWVNARKTVEFAFATQIGNAFSRESPCLAIDLWEHAYFTDYGFDRSAYLKAALPRLDLARLDEFEKKD